MYKELLIFPKALEGEPLFPDTARKLVAKACDGYPVAQEIFARQPDGRTEHRMFGRGKQGKGYGATPSVCFGGGRGFIQLYGIGKTGSEVLCANGASVATAISRLHGNCPYRFVMNEGHCKVQGSNGGAVAYRIRNLIVSKRHAEYGHITADGLPALPPMEPMIKRAIYRGLVGQALQLDKELGTNYSSVFGTQDSLDIQLFDGKPFFSQIKEGVKSCALGIHGLTFTMACRLIGPWFTGHLRSRGFGYIESGRIA